MIKLYTVENCPMCELLKRKLYEKDIEFEVIQSTSILKEKRITHVPIMELNDKMLTYKESLKWIQEQN